MTGSNCSLPIQHALQHNILVDCFIYFTDSICDPDAAHPAEVLKQYREKMEKPDTKMVVVAMKSNNTTIIDSTDSKMMEVCATDSHLLKIINEFV